MAYMKDSNGRRLDSFPLRHPTSKTTYVALGDSFVANGGGPAATDASTTQFSANGWVPWMDFFLAGKLRCVRSAGVGGQTTTQILDRLSTDVDPYNPGWVIGGSGINDISQGHTYAQIVNDLTNLFNYLINIRGYRVAWCTVPPNNNLTGGAPMYALIQQVNSWLRKAPEAWPNLTVPDLYSVMVNPSGATNSTTAWTTDGLHPNATGAARIGAMVANAISPQLSPVPVLEMQNGSATNLIQNGRFQTAQGNGLAASWTLFGTTSGTMSLVPRTDRNGNWQQVVLPSDGSSPSCQIIQDRPISGFASIGDKVWAGIEIRQASLEAAPPAASQRFRLMLQFLDGSSVQTGAVDALYSDGSTPNHLYPFNNEDLILRTIPWVIPANTVTIRTYIRVYGGGTYQFDCATINKV